MKTLAFEVDWQKWEGFGGWYLTEEISISPIIDQYGPALLEVIEGVLAERKALLQALIDRYGVTE